MRLTPRFVVSAPVDWHVEGASAGFRSITRDVSEGGVRIESFAPPAVGSLVELRLGVRRILVRGTVARALSGGFAVQFRDPEGPGHQKLRRRLRRLERPANLIF